MKVASAQPAVTEGFCVGDSKQGTIPIRLAVKMKRKMVPKYPMYRRPSCPI